MNILLIRPPEIRGKSKTPLQSNITGIYPPLGLAYIAAFLREKGYNIKVLDLEIFTSVSKYLPKMIKEFHPRVVLLTVNIFTWPEVVNTSRMVKEISPNIIIGVGGPSVSLYPIEFISHETIDFGVYGEGEETILEILECIGKNKDLESIKGCIFKKDGKIIMNSPREEIPDLDKLPFPAIDLLPYKKYFAFSVKSPFFSLITSRGCPFRCKFCYPDALGRYRVRSPESVVEEMELYVNKYRIREIIVFDDTFAVDKEKAIEICEKIIKKKLKFSWDIRTRIDLLDRELLLALKNAGCYRINIGIESGDGKILDKMNKGFVLFDIKHKVKLAKKIGMEVRGYFMIGYPGESYKTILKTIEFAKTLPLDWASFTITVGLPKTEIYHQALTQGYFPCDVWKEYIKGDWENFVLPLYCSENLERRDLFYLRRKAYREFYFRSSKILEILSHAKILNIVKNFPQFLRILPAIYKSTMGI